MTAPVRPAASKALQNTKWTWVPTIANVQAPTAVELNAVGALDISCYLFSDSDTPTITVNRVTAPQRVCDGALAERLGTITYAGGVMHVAWDPQGASGSAGKAAWAKLAGGSTGYLVRRAGKNYVSDYASGEFVDVWPVELATPFPSTNGSGDAAENSFDSAYGITSTTPGLDVAVV